MALIREIVAWQRMAYCWLEHGSSSDQAGNTKVMLRSVCPMHHPCNTSMRSLGVSCALSLEHKPEEPWIWQDWSHCSGLPLPVSLLTSYGTSHKPGTCQNTMVILQWFLLLTERIMVNKTEIGFYKDNRFGEYSWAFFSLSQLWMTNLSLDNIYISFSFQCDLEHFCKLERKTFFNHSHDWAGYRYGLTEHFSCIICMMYFWISRWYLLPPQQLAPCYERKEITFYEGTRNLWPSYKCWLRLLWRKRERRCFLEQSITAQKNSCWDPVGRVQHVS